MKKAIAAAVLAAAVSIILNGCASTLGHSPGAAAGAAAARQGIADMAAAAGRPIPEYPGKSSAADTTGGGSSVVLPWNTGLMRTMGW